MNLRVTRVRKLYSDGRHNAFTGISRFGDHTYVVFRNATGHIAPDGAAQVLRTADPYGPVDAWEPVHRCAVDGLDLRDPKLVAYDGRLLVYTGAKQDGVCTPMVIQSVDGVTYDGPIPCKGVDNRWLWYFAQHNGALYGTAYEAGDEYHVLLARSDDGETWEPVVDFPTPGNEVAIDFDDDGRLYALLRSGSAGSIPTYCVAEPPYEAFAEVRQLPVKLQGPMIKRLDGGCVLIARNWSLRRWNVRTEIFWLPDGGDLQSLRWLPSGGDTSYAGWLDTGPGKALVSYYSSHEHRMDLGFDEEHLANPSGGYAHSVPAADIFLADVEYPSGS